jgi:hypothetical protein
MMKMGIEKAGEETDNIEGCEMANGKKMGK